MDERIPTVVGGLKRLFDNTAHSHELRMSVGDKFHAILRIEEHGDRYQRLYLMWKEPGESEGQLLFLVLPNELPIIVYKG